MTHAPDEERVVHMEGGWPAEIARLKARLRAVEDQLAKAHVCPACGETRGGE